MASASNSNKITITVTDMAGKEYEMIMNKNDTILDIKRNIFEQHPEYVVPIQKLMYRPSKNATHPNKKKIPYRPEYNNKSYNKENPYYVLDNKQKISFWNFPQDVTLDLLIDSEDYISEPIILYFYILLQRNEPGLSHLSSDDALLFLVSATPGMTFKSIYKIICAIYGMNGSNTCMSGKSNEFTLYRLKNAYLESQDKIVYQKINPTDIIDESYRHGMGQHLCIDDARINAMSKPIHTDPYSILRYSPPIRNADKIVKRIQELRRKYDKLVNAQHTSGGYRRTRHRRHCTKRSNKRRH